MKHAIVGLAIAIVLSSCAAPGRQAAERAVIRPTEVADFHALYAENCSGCHGDRGQNGLSVAIGSPVYLAIADDATIRRITEDGATGTAMPAFSRKAGGLLTDAQIEILVGGIRSWANPGALGADSPPAYAAPGPGDATRGAKVFSASCSSCHGSDNHGAAGGGTRAITDVSYLSLVTDQHLRTVIISGMPHLGMPDWRHHSKPLSDADVNDVVAWLSAQRATLSAQLHRSGATE